MAIVTIDPDLCDNTQACEAVCPTDVFAIEGGRVYVADTTECVLCMHCLENCPEGAIEVD